MEFKWNELEKWLENQKLPQGFEMLREPGWVEQFVRNMMSKSIPETEKIFNSDIDVAVKESDQFIHLSFMPPVGCQIRKLRIQTRENLVRISGFPNGLTKEVSLPAMIRAKECRAYMKDGIVRIKLRKRAGRRSWSEHSIIE